MVLVAGFCHPTGEPDNYNGAKLNHSTLDEHARRVVGCPVHHEHPDNPLQHESKRKVGRVVDAIKTKNGLKVIMDVDEWTVEGSALLKMVRDKKLNALSLGGGVAVDEDGRVMGHRITEISFTENPAFEGTHLTAMERERPERTRAREAAIEDVKRYVSNQTVYNTREAAGVSSESNSDIATMSTPADTNTPKQSQPPQPKKEESTHVPTPEAQHEQKLAEIAAKRNVDVDSIKRILRDLDSEVEQKNKTLEEQHQEKEKQKQQQSAGRTFEIDGESVDENMLRELMQLAKREQVKRQRLEKKEQEKYQKLLPMALDFMERIMPDQTPTRDQIIQYLKDDTVPALEKKPLMEVAVAASRDNENNVRTWKSRWETSKRNEESLRMIATEAKAELQQFRERSAVANEVNAKSGQKRKAEAPVSTTNSSSTPAATPASNMGRELMKHATLDDGVRIGPTLFDTSDMRAMMMKFSQMQD